MGKARKVRKNLGLRPDMPAADAAAELAREAFNRLRKRAKRVRQGDGVSAEDIHDLRVEARHAGAVLRALGDCYKPKRCKRASKLARGVRQSAGDAREADVQAELLLARLDATEGDEARAIGAMLQRIGADRDRGRRELETSLADLKPKRIRALGERLAETARSKCGTLGAARDRALDRIGGTFEERARGRLTSLDDLHSFRVSAKRLRYTVDILLPTMDEGAARQVLKITRDLQDELGEINDRRDLCERAEGVLADAEEIDDRTRGGLRALRVRLSDEIDERIGQFRFGWEEGGRQSALVALGRLRGVTASRASA